MGTFDGIEFFATSVQSGSFAGAAKKLGLTPSAVSRRVARLEDELGVQLLARTTRTLRLTDDGRAFYERCVRILGEVHEAKSDFARARKQPSGVLRVDTAIGISRHVLAPRIPKFLERYPEIRLELTVRDQLIDPIAEGLDVIVRLGGLSDSSLIARRLGEARIVFCGAPAYVRRRGAPSSPRDLKRHDVIGYLRDGQPNPWRFIGGEGIYAVEVSGSFHASDVDTIVTAALAGRGLIAVFDFLVEEHLQTGALVRVLEQHPSTTAPIHALYPPNRHLLPKVRVFLDFLSRLFAAPRVK
jgi:DNA-binding transcriptional LysR family regulator